MAKRAQIVFLAAFLSFAYLHHTVHTTTLTIALLFQFLERPLLPIGCVATAYFLFSGIRSFQKRDPVTSQKMMRNRVAAQFLTLACFVGYLGTASAGADWRLAPHTQDAWKQQGGSGNSGDERQ